MLMFHLNKSDPLFEKYETYIQEQKHPREVNKMQKQHPIKYAYLQ